MIASKRLIVADRGARLDRVVPFRPEQTPRAEESLLARLRHGQCGPTRCGHVEEVRRDWPGVRLQAPRGGPRAVPTKCI
jgi:hypothetical protein